MDNKIDWKAKFASRKFWLCAAAFLASMATGIGSAFSGNEVLGAAGIFCGILSASIYAACEAAVDRASIQSDTVSTVTTVERNINVTSNDKETAKAIMISETNPPVMGDE